MMPMADDRWAAIGVVSWGIRCGEPTKPGLYTRISILSFVFVFQEIYLSQIVQVYTSTGFYQLFKVRKLMCPAGRGYLKAQVLVLLFNTKFN